MNHIPDEWRALREYNVASLRRAHAAAQTAEERARVVARADSMGVEPSELGATDSTRLADGETLVVRSDGNAACKCDGGSCSCRSVKRSALTQERRADAVDRRDADDASGLMFGQCDLSKARAWLGAERLAELQSAADTEWNAQQAVARQSSSRGAYCSVMVAAIAAAHPDLAGRAATENLDWVHSQYRALPDPPNATDPEQETKTDMANDPYETAKAAEAKRKALAYLLGPDSKPTNQYRYDCEERAYDSRVEAQAAHARNRGRKEAPPVNLDAVDTTPDAYDAAAAKARRAAVLAGSRPLGTATGERDTLGLNALTPEQQARLDGVAADYDAREASRAELRRDKAARPVVNVDATDGEGATLDDVKVLQELQAWAKQNGLTLPEALDALERLKELKANDEPRADSLEAARARSNHEAANRWKQPIN